MRIIERQSPEDKSGAISAAMTNRPSRAPRPDDRAPGPMGCLAAAKGRARVAAMWRGSGGQVQQGVQQVTLERDHLEATKARNDARNAHSQKAWAVSMRQKDSMVS